MALGRARGGIKRASGVKNHDGFEQSSSDSDDPLQADIRVGDDKHPTPYKPHLSSCTSSIFLSNHFSSEDFCICFWLTVDRSLLFCSRNSVVALLLPCALWRQYFGKESRCVSIPHPYTALRAHSVVWWSQRFSLLSQVMSQVQFNGSQKFNVQNRVTAVPLG